MLAEGIIEPSSSAYSASIVLVTKKDGSLRLCVDYRKLYKSSQTDAYPMPRIDDPIDGLGNSWYISTSDLTKGYWQVPVAMEDRPKTVFVTPYGLYQFRVMPFGLQGAPAKFQRLMDRVIAGLGDFTSTYLDDVIIFSDTWEDHLRHVRTTLERLREAGLTVKAKKSQLGTDHCVYFGHLVGSGIVQPDSAKVQIVWEFPTPGTKTQVRTFLGRSGYYCLFIPQYASIASTLTDLTKKSAPNVVDWTDSCEQAFHKLKSLLCTSPTLASPDFKRPFILQTDASDIWRYWCCAKSRRWEWCASQSLRRSVWQSKLVLLHSKFTFLFAPSKSKLTVVLRSGSTNSKTRIPDWHVGAIPVSSFPSSRDCKRPWRCPFPCCVKEECGRLWIKGLRLWIGLVIVCCKDVLIC